MFAVMLPVTTSAMSAWLSLGGMFAILCLVYLGNPGWVWATAERRRITVAVLVAAFLASAPVYAISYCCASNKWWCEIFGIC
jgi:hypothetical protein